MDSFTPTGFSETIFKQRYALTPDETWEQCCDRVAKQMALAEKPEKMNVYKDKFKDILVQNLFVPGGRIWYNSGRNNPTLLNCFVLSDQLDSKEGWGNIAREMIITSMCGGGVGISFDSVRPNGAPIRQGGVCPGPVSLMELINGCAEPVRNGGGRRVALMFSLDLLHPDIEQFLNAKLVNGRLSFANVSVKSKITTEFIKAVKSNSDIELSWKGQFKRKINARDLWNIIVKNAYNSAEPGFLNWELVEKENNIWYFSELSTTNPCGEQPLNPYSSCCLGHLVLSRFVNKSNDDLDWTLFGNTIRLAVRFLDNVLSVNSYPIPEMKSMADKLRRIGLGVTGYSDMLALLGFRYGSPEANRFTDKLFRFISKISYESSVMLAIEKGPFPECNPEKFLESGFMKRMTNKIRSLVSEHGIRNCCINTVAPTGTVSILSDNCSAGIEPMFAPAYNRNFFKGEERLKELVFHPLFYKFMQEGKSTEHFCGSRDLSVREHMEVQKIVQKHIDSAVSKTINIPFDYPVEDMSALWIEYLPYLKGTTFYRENTRGYVAPDGTVHEPPLVALSLEEAKEKYMSETSPILGSEVDCPSGVCEIDFK